MYVNVWKCVLVTVLCIHWFLQDLRVCCDVIVVLHAPENVDAGGCERRVSLALFCSDFCFAALSCVLLGTFKPPYPPTQHDTARHTNLVQFQHLPNILIIVHHLSPLDTSWTSMEKQGNITIVLRKYTPQKRI